MPDPWKREVPAAERSLDLRPGSRPRTSKLTHCVCNSGEKLSVGTSTLKGMRRLRLDRLGPGLSSGKRSWKWTFRELAWRLVSTRPTEPWSWAQASPQPFCNEQARVSKSGEDGSCPFCQSPDGHWRHIMWLCPQNRLHDSAPSNPFAERLGRITQGVGSW